MTHFGYSCLFLVVLIVLSIILMVLVMTELSKGILVQLKMFYKENEQKSKRMFIMQKF